MRLLTLFILLISAACHNKQNGQSKGEAEHQEFVDDLDLSKMIQQVDTSVYRFIEDDYATWGGNIFKEEGIYYLIYSRWKEDWLTDSEIAIAKSSSLEGPYEHLSVLLKGRGQGYWDELTAHNPKMKKYDGKYYLYYISSKSGKTRSHQRDSQRIGVAVSESLTGPFIHCDQPTVEPAAPVHNITVNPGVVRRPDGKYVMILKGDKVAKTPEEPMGKRVQGIALAASPEGPFEIQPELAIKDFDTEDASIWFDKNRSLFYAVYHAHSHVGLIVSENAINWKPAVNSRIMEKFVVDTKQDTILLRSVERPFVFYEEGNPAAICLSVRRGKTYNSGSCIIIPLRPTP